MSRYFSKYGISATMSLPITDEISAHVGSYLRGVFLGLVEVYQRQKRWQDAIACLGKLQRLEPDNVVVKLSLAELLLDAHPGDKNVCQKVVWLVVTAALRRKKGRSDDLLRAHGWEDTICNDSEPGTDRVPQGYA